MSALYTVEVCLNGRWLPVVSDARGYCQGYLAAALTERPRAAMRLVRRPRDTSASEVIEEHSAVDTLDVGMIAGYPTADQLARAALKAVERIHPLTVEWRRLSPKGREAREAAVEALRALIEDAGPAK